MLLCLQRKKEKKEAVNGFLSTLLLCWFVTVWSALGMRCPSSPAVPEHAEMSAELDSLSGMSVSLSAFLCLFCLLVSQPLPFFLSPLVHSPAFLSVCKPLYHLLLFADWAFSTTHRAEPPRKINSLVIFSSDCLWEPPSTKQIMSCTTTANPLPPPLHFYFPLFPLYHVKTTHCNLL